MPTPPPTREQLEQELAEIQKRRQWFQDVADGKIEGDIQQGATDDNIHDINRQKEIEAQFKQEAEYARLSGNYANPNAPGVFIDANGDMRGRGVSLQDSTASLIDGYSQASNAYQFGGRPGGAQAEVDRARGLSGQFDNRGAILADYSQADQSRGEQQGALGLYRDAAMGRGPSAAHAQFQQGLDHSLAGNMALANSARGGSLALAQGRLAAAGQNSNMLAGSTAQAAQLRAQEQQAAMGGYAGLAGQIRGQDASQAQAQAGFGIANRGLNDARAAAYEQQAWQTQQAQMQAQMAKQQAILQSQGVSAQAAAQNASLQAQNDAHSEDNTLKYIGIGAGVAGSIGGALLASQLGGSDKGATRPGGGTGENNPTPGGSGNAGASGSAGASDLPGATSGGLGTAGYKPGLYGGGTAAPTPPRQPSYTATGTNNPYRRTW